MLTERARRWAFEQVGEQDACGLAVADRLGVAWWTVLNQVIARGVALVEDPARLDPAPRDTRVPQHAVRLPLRSMPVPGKRRFGWPNY